MTDDRSCGTIPFRIVDGTPFFLLVWEKLGKGHWGFPKGHPHCGESDEETALRELFEETGLVPQIVLDEDSFVLSYTFRHRGWKIHKTVNFFLALMGDEEPRPQEEEIGVCRWMTLEEIVAVTPHPELKELVQSAYSAIVQYQQG